ncbi:hypothetical protein [Promicromonospora sp. NPDC019610]|uniref:hypothetical protein n=1 Tax=Promicromonospora sp. NPDC019610 TaxID=3364405 RepID=UPI0037A1C71F
MTDAMKQLKAADPVGRADLDAVEPVALATLREEIIMTGTQLDAAEAERTAAAAGPSRASTRKLGRRGAVVVGLAAVLAGGGVAYAAIQAFVAQDTAGLTCMATWNDSALEGQGVDAGGPWLTGDAVADCTTMLAEAGLPPVADPVVFEHDGWVYVTPADQAPDWAEPIDTGSGPAADAAVIELRQSLGDRVDGGSGACRTIDEAVVWAQSELDRLGLEGWTIETEDANDPTRACSTVSAEETGKVLVWADADPDDVYGVPELDPMVSALREVAASECPTIEQLSSVVDEELASLGHHWPTTTVEDDAARCARVDMVVGGSVQVTVYGPPTAG